MLYFVTDLEPCVDFTEPDSDNPNGAAPTHKEKNLRVVLEYPGSIEPEKYVSLMPFFILSHFFLHLVSCC